MFIVRTINIQLPVFNEHKAILENYNRTGSFKVVDKLH